MLKRIFLTVSFISAACLLWARFVEPGRLEVTHHTVDAPVSPKVKIAHVTDLHSRGRLGPLEEKVLAALAEEQPDLIVMSGDDEDADAFHDRLKAPLGVFFVYGNHDHWAHHLRKDALDNAAAQVRDGLWVVGLDDALAGDPDLDLALKGVPQDAYRIGLYHSPVLFDLTAAAFPLAFAGHTHGGQVRLPLLPPLWLPRGSGPYLEGWYERAGSKLYVSRGIGTSVLPLRFFCRPELAIITLGR